jgi:hypothetical protein
MVPCTAVGLAGGIVSLVGTAPTSSTAKRFRPLSLKSDRDLGTYSWGLLYGERSEAHV